VLSKSKIKSKLQLLEILIIILVSFSPLISNEIKAGLALLITLVNVKLLFKKTNANKLILLLILMGIFTINATLDLRNVLSLSQYSILNLYFPLCFLLGFIISEKYSIFNFLNLIDKIIFIMSIFSLIGVFIYTFFPDIINNLPSYQYYHTNHKTAYIFNIIFSNGRNVLKRNAGIAWEPGAFQFLVNIGLFSHLYTTKKINMAKIFIYSLAIITTKSTAGMLIFMILTFKLFIKNKRARILIILSSIVLSGRIINELIYQFKYKLFGSYAFNTRLEPLLNAFIIGKNYIFGMGNSGYSAKLSELKIGAYDSFGQIFIRYGYFMFIIILLFLLKIFFQEQMLFIIIFISFLSQGIWFLPFVTPFYFMDFKKNERKGVNNIYQIPRDIPKSQKKLGELFENTVANKCIITRSK